MRNRSHTTAAQMKAAYKVVIETCSTSSSLKVMKLYLSLYSDIYFIAIYILYSDI